MKVLRLISRRCNRRDWIQIRIAGDYPIGNNLVNTVQRLLKGLQDLGLVTKCHDRGPNFSTSGPTYRLTEAGRGALSHR